MTPIEKVRAALKKIIFHGEPHVGRWAQEALSELDGCVIVNADKLAMVKASLEFYANKENWQLDPNGIEVFYERSAGAVAKEALYMLQPYTKGEE